MSSRGLNSIYLQARQIKPADEKAFCNYAANWYKLLHIHHTGEEATLFPEIEHITGEKGLMDANVEQHHAFHDGLEAFIAYINDCIAGKQKYDGEHVIQMIDGFGKTLVQHLTDEIPTLQDLRKHSDKLQNISQLMQAEAETNMKKLGMATGMAWAWGHMDVDYEDGIWKDFPPAPWLIKFIIKNIAWWVHSDWWRFSAADRHGRLRPLPFAVEE